MAGIYDADGKIRMKSVPGTSFTGLYSADGEINAVTTPTGSYRGVQHPCGAYNVTIDDSSTVGGRYAADGSYRVSMSSTTNGALPVSGLSNAAIFYNLWADSNGGAVFSFEDDTAYIVDPVTPANNYSGSARTYFRTIGSYSGTQKWTPNAAGIYTQNTSGDLPYTYNTSGANLGYIPEEARTNSTFPSENWHTSGSWVVVSGVGGGKLAGSTSALHVGSVTSRLNAGGTSPQYFVAPSFAATSGVTYTISVYITGGNSVIQIAGGSGIFGTSKFCNFDLSDGTYTATGCTAGIEVLTSGAKRIWITASATATASAAACAIALVTSKASARLESFTASGQYVEGYGLQVEAGAFPTSYILTTSAAVTRTADNASVATSALPYSATNGTLFVKGQTPNATSTAIRSWAALSDNSINERIALRVAASATVPSLVVVDGGAVQANLNAGSGTIAANTTFRAAGVYKVDDFACVLNGGTVGTDALGTLPTVATLFLQGDGQSGTFNTSNSTAAMIAYFPRRTSNANLQSMTT